ncbi:MAG: hypothetical protein HY574_02645 [candidate division NC10 bacterium]|nr:hypothetical protein [candidate division NC10 bacterium]
MDKSAQVTLLRQDAPKTREFILLGAGPYEGELAAALVSQGFKVRPIAIRQSVSELENPERLVQYREAGYRYALKLNILHDYAWACSFSGGHRVQVTMSVIDISTNETLALFRQIGPDRECPPLTPVWPLLAKELDKSWR